MEYNTIILLFEQVESESLSVITTADECVFMFVWAADKLQLTAGYHTGTWLREKHWHQPLQQLNSHRTASDTWREPVCTVTGTNFISFSFVVLHWRYYSIRKDFFCLTPFFVKTLVIHLVKVFFWTAILCSCSSLTRPAPSSSPSILTGWKHTKCQTGLNGAKYKCVHQV